MTRQGNLLRGHWLQGKKVDLEHPRDELESSLWNWANLVLPLTLCNLGFVAYPL